MTDSAPATTVRTFADRADALGFFFLHAGDAPRLVAYDDEVGCPLHNALSALEWTLAVGILDSEDHIHAARLSGETAAAMVERRRESRRSFVYFGPRMDAPPADPYEGTLLYDEPGVRAYEFAQRVHALAHFLRATQGVGATLSMLSKRAPVLLHVKRWLAALLSQPAPQVSNQMLAGWFAAAGGGVLHVPSGSGPYVYQETGLEP